MSGILMSSSYTGVLEPPVNPILLCHFDGANNSTTITDNSLTPKTLTVAGNARISTAQSVFGGASLFLDGTGDYVQSTSSDYALGTGDLTIEGRVRFAVVENTGVFQISNTLFAGVSGIGFGLDGLNRWLVYHGTNQFEAVSGPAANTWYAWALTRSSNFVRLYINGTRVINQSATPVNITGTVLGIGGIFSTGFTMNGYIDEMRIANTALYTGASYTVSNSAFPNP